jgi:hypothetical protein
MRGHQHESIFVGRARENRDHIGQIYFAQHLTSPRAFLYPKVLKTDLKARAVTLKFAVDPSSRRSRDCLPQVTTLQRWWRGTIVTDL